MTFAENINRICKARGVTLTAFIKSLGMSTSKVTAINNGSLPKETEMVLFAEKLNCSVMDFFADAEDLSRRYSRRTRTNRTFSESTVPCPGERSMSS